MGRGGSSAATTASLFNDSTSFLPSKLVPFSYLIGGLFVGAGIALQVYVKQRYVRSLFLPV